MMMMISDEDGEGKLGCKNMIQWCRSIGDFQREMRKDRKQEEEGEEAKEGRTFITSASMRMPWQAKSSTAK